jgi:hypothetical protein
MRRRNQMERRKVKASMTKTVSRPNCQATRPPMEAPTARLNDQVIEDSALATSTSSREEQSLGMIAWRPGSNSAHMVVSRNSRA